MRVIGELDLANAPLVREELVALTERGLRTVTVDSAELDFIDSTGLSVLVTALKGAREPGGATSDSSLEPTP